MADSSDVNRAREFFAGAGRTRPIDGERADRLILAVLEDDVDAFRVTLLQVCRDDEGPYGVNALFNVVGVLCAAVSRMYQDAFGDGAADAVRGFILESLRADEPDPS